MEISGDKGVLIGEVRVSEDSKVLAGESNRGTVISANDRNSVESSNLRSNDRHDLIKKRTVDKVTRNDRWESWGVMNMVGRVLGGRLCMDDEVENVDDPENRGEVNLVKDMNVWRDGIGKRTSENRGEVNLVAEIDSCQDVIGEQTSENRGEVNLVAEIDSCQDVIGERTSETQGEVNLVAEMNACQDVIGEPASAKGVDLKRTDINSDSVKLDLGFNGDQDLVSCEIVPDGQFEPEGINDVKADVLRPEGFGENEEVSDARADVLIPSGEQDLLINEIVPDVTLETEKVNDVKADVLVPTECGEKTKKEGEYNVSDLVWGKVKSHPWWPGQIFAPSDASDKARKYFKKESYLVAYFGDQSFAWNEGTKLMPFRKYFSEMEKQSNSDGLSHAVSCTLDETARRVEFGLSCPCWAQDVREEMKFQIVENSGIREESSIRAGGDNISSAARFLPGDVLQFLESLAKCPQSKHDRLQFTIAKAQLQAYTRWKGYDQLPVFEQNFGLLEDDTQINVMGKGNDTIEMEGLLSCAVSDAANDTSSKKRKSTAENGSAGKRERLSGDEEHPKIKEKFMSVLMSSRSSISQNNDKVYVRKTSRKIISSIKSREMVSSTSKRRKTLQSTGADVDAKLAENREPQIVEIIPAEIPSPDVILSKLILAAKMPLQKGRDAMIPVLGWLREFRNSICEEKYSLTDQNVDLGKPTGEESSQAADILGFGGSEDSYWTDRIIHSCSRDQTMSEYQKPYRKGLLPESDVAVVPNLDENKESNNVLDFDTRLISAPGNEVAEEYSPTALILNFKSLDSIPTVKNLNEIFSRYGSLDESETKILSKSKRVKVVFKRPTDAETAFSSAGKYSIFGPSLVSYRLQYTPKPRKNSKKKKKEGKQSKEGTSENVDTDLN